VGHTIGDVIAAEYAQHVATTAGHALAGTTTSDHEGSSFGFRDLATIYAAVVATSAFGWQVWTWRQQHSPPEVRVSLACMAFAEPLWTVAVKAINNRDQTVNVRSVGLLLQDGSERDWVFVRPLSVSTLPGAVGAHDAAQAFVPMSDVEQDFDLYRPIVGWARLASGKVVRSDPVTLKSADPAGASPGRPEGR
jgi:hypothetical protein